MKITSAKRAMGTVLATGTVLTAVSIAALATPVSAASKPEPHKSMANAGATPLHAPCGRSGPNLSNVTAHTFDNFANIRTGSSTSCTSVGQAQISHTLDLFCWTIGNDGFAWTYLKDITTGKLGWIRDDLLNWTGTLQSCGF